MNNDLQEVPPIGENLKRERTARHLSLGALAETSGISKAMLSQIESGRVNPTLVTLWKAAQALQVDINLLIGGKAKKPEHFSFLGAKQQAVIADETGKTEFKLLTAPEMHKELEMYYVTMRPGAVHRSEPHAAGCGEFILVVKGRVRVTAGSRTAELGEGDFLAYQGDLPHQLENLGDGETVLHMTDLTLR